MKIGTNINTARLICDVMPEELAEFKKRAREQGITLRQYVYESLIIRKQLEDKKKVIYPARNLEG